MTPTKPRFKGNVLIERFGKSGYVLIPNETVRDAHLSFRARGVLAYLLSHSDSFLLTEATVREAGLEGRDAIKAALRELEKWGYLQRKKRRLTGQFSTFYVWKVRDRPVDNPVDNPVDRTVDNL